MLARLGLPALVFILLCLVVMPGVAPADEGDRITWSRQFGFGGRMWDSGEAVLEAENGDFVITGYSKSLGGWAKKTIYAYLLRVDSDGNTVWQKRLGRGWGYAVEEASDGGFLVAGSVESTERILHDVYLAKAHGNGTLHWERTLGSGQAFALRRTHDSGYVIAGYSNIGNGLDDMLLIKTDCYGNQTWRKSIGGCGNERAYDVKQTADGDFIVAGYTESYGTGTRDAFLARTDASGELQWRRSYGANGTDIAYAVETSGDGGYVIAGATQRGGTGTNDIYLVKTDSSGYVVWERCLGNRFSDEAFSLDRTADGGFILAGRSRTSLTGDYDTYVIKVNRDGLVTWETHFGGTDSDEAHSVRQTSNGGYVVAGTSTSVGSRPPEIYVVSIASEPRPARSPSPSVTPGPTPIPGNITGTQYWAVTYDGNSTEHDYSTVMAIDSSGNIHVAGYSRGGNITLRDYATIKYSGTGTQTWAKRYNGTGSGDDFASAIAVDATGYVHVTGASEGSSTGRDFATIKYADNGDQSWVARFDGPLSGDDFPRSIALDKAGNVYVAGSSQGNESNQDFTIIKYHGSGTQQWVDYYAGTAGGDDFANDVTTDGAGNAWATGRSWGGTLPPYTVDPSSSFVTIAYDANGNRMWLDTYVGPAPGYNSAEALALDVSGDLYVAGTSEGGVTGLDCALLKYDPLGHRLWSARYSYPGNGTDIARSMVTDASRNVYLAGYSLGNGTGYDYLTMKYDSDGNLLWNARYDGPAGGDDVASAIAIDQFGSSYVSGCSQGNGTAYDFATVKYDSQGNLMWVARYDGGNGSDDRARALALDTTNEVYVTGSSTGTKVDSDYVTVKYSQTGIPPATPTPTPTPTPAPTPTPTPSGNATATEVTRVDMSSRVTPAGLVLQYTDVYTPDEMAWLEILLGTTVLTQETAPVQTMLASRAGSPVDPPTGSTRIGYAYDFGPDGVTFDPAIAINITYDADSLPAGVSAEALRIAYYDTTTEQWVYLDTTVNTTSHVATAQITHLTAFALHAGPSGGGLNIALIIGPLGGFLLFIGLVFYLNAKGEKRLQEKGVSTEGAAQPA